MNDTITASYLVEHTPNNYDNDAQDNLFVEVDDEEYIPMTNEDIDAMFE